MARTRAGWLHTLAVLVSLAAPAAVAVNTGRVEYYHHDALGNVRVVTDEAGRVLERHDYLPFGEECTTGACAANPGIDAGQPRRFAGQQRDPETGLDSFVARYYAQRVGRFTSLDPVFNWNANLRDPQRWNRYAYGRNNPLRYVDPDGRDVVDVVGGSINAFGSNLILGAGRAAPYSSDYALGQSLGDVASLAAGLYETVAGGSIAAGGGLVTATGVGAPVGAPAAVVGAGVAAHGVGVSASGLIHLSQNREGMGFTQAGKRQIDQANAEKYGGRNVCENCQSEVTPGKRHEKGATPPASERQRDHVVPRSKGGRGIPDNGQILCRDCNIKKSND
jgi:RHS repeat-associated protein